MVIFADGFPEAWFGHRFAIQSQDQPPHVVKIEGVMNGTTLLASNGNQTPTPFINIQGFAKGLLTGVIHKVD